MQFGGRHRIAAQRLDQRRAQRFALADPAAHAGSVKRHAITRRDRRLSIQRLVVCVFRDEDVRQQARMGDAPFDRQTRHRRLLDAAAAWANEFAPDRANDSECRCDPGELFGHILAEHLHCLTAVRATRFGLKHMILAREVRR